MPPLELVRPGALWGLALAAPIVLFHLYHRRRVRVVVPFVGLIREGLGPVRPAARFKRLREGASLAARLLALACLVLALAGLRPAEAAVPPLDLVVVVDADVTTRAVEGDGRSRFAHALELAEAWVRHHDGGRVGAVLALETPVVLAAPADDPEAVAARLAALRARVAGAQGPRPDVGPAPAAVTTDLEAAVRTAADAARARGAGRVVVVSARPFAPAAEDVRVVGAGTTRDDQGIVDFQITGASRFRARVRVHNEDTEAVTRTLVATVGDAPLAEASLEVPAGGHVEHVLEGTSPAGGAWLAVRLAGADAFPRNDAVTAWVVAPARPSVLLVHGDTKRLATLLVLEGLADAVDRDRSGLVHADRLAQAAPRDVTIVDGVPVAPGALRPGGWLFIAPFAGALPFETGPAIDAPLVWRTETGHPLVRWLDFAPAHVRRGTALRGEGLRPLAYADGKAVIAEGERDGVRYVALGLDPDRSLAPVQAALPLFLRRAVRRLADAPVRPLRPFYRAGEVLRARAPLPGGPWATVAWTARAGAGGRTRARIDPGAKGVRVPPGAQGTVVVFTGTEADPTWEGRTAFLDLDPGRSVAPARPPGTPPAPRPEGPAAADVWWRVLVAAALLLLLLDIALVPRAVARRAA